MRAILNVKIIQVRFFVIARLQLNKVNCNLLRSVSTPLCPERVRGPVHHNFTARPTRCSGVTLCERERKSGTEEETLCKCGCRCVSEREREGASEMKHTGPHSKEPSY